jgi:hypothetical protein
MKFFSHQGTKGTKFFSSKNKENEDFPLPAAGSFVCFVALWEKIL